MTLRTHLFMGMNLLTKRSPFQRPNVSLFSHLYRVGTRAVTFDPSDDVHSEQKYDLAGPHVDQAVYFNVRVI